MFLPHSPEESGSSYSLRNHHRKTDEAGYLFTSAHIRVLFCFPPFREMILKVYQETLAGPAPRFPAEMETNIDAYLRGELPPKESMGFVNPDGVVRSDDNRTEGCSAKPVLLSTSECELPGRQRNTIYRSKNESGRLIITNE
jgi:hypothetical protein